MYYAFYQNDFCKDLVTQMITNEGYRLDLIVSKE